MDAAPSENEVAALKARLQEAEALCDAIRNGEVDAVLAGPSEEHKRILFLSGTYARYRQIVEDMAQGAVTLTAQGEILFANHAFSRMLGEDLLDLFRTRFGERVARQDRERFFGMLRPRPGQPDIDLALGRNDGSSFRARLSLVTASDDFITLIVTELPGRDAEEGSAMLEAIRGGAVDGFVIGEEVRLFAEAHDVYRTLAQRMEQGALAASPGGTVTYANERFADMVGMPVAHLLGRPLASLVAESHRDRLGALLNSNESAHAELDLRRGNGMTTSAHVTAARMDGSHLLLFTDVSLQKRHEAADERMRRFLGMLAHEFGNILGPIAQANDQLKRSPGLEAESQKAVSLIEHQTARLMALVDDLRRVNPQD